MTADLRARVLRLLEDLDDLFHAELCHEHRLELAAVMAELRAIDTRDANRKQELEAIAAKLKADREVADNIKMCLAQAISTARIDAAIAAMRLRIGF